MCDRIDTAFAVAGRTERRAIVEIGAPIPLAVPARTFDFLVELVAFAKLGEPERAWQLFNIINPINHGRTPAEVATYKIEPYVLAADVYGVAPHTGRGGWSWYTGSAGWMYRLLIESLLGLNLRSTEQGQHLSIEPCLPDGWDSYTVSYRHANTDHLFTVQRALSTDELKVGNAVPMPLHNDGGSHEVTITV